MNEESTQYEQLCKGEFGELHAKLDRMVEAIRGNGKPGIQFRRDREILLGLGDLRYPRVTILSDQIAAEAGELVVIHLSHAALAKFDHFARAQSDSADRYRIDRKKLWPS